jgi:hypothetical protein
LRRWINCTNEDFYEQVLRKGYIEMEVPDDEYNTEE